MFSLSLCGESGEAREGTNACSFSAGIYLKFSQRDFFLPRLGEQYIEEVQSPFLEGDSLAPARKPLGEISLLSED